MVTQKPRGARCVSHLAIDRLLAGELSDREAARLKAHVSECARCRETFAMIAKGRDAFASDLPRALREREAAERIAAPPNARRPALVFGLGSLSIAAALLLWVGQPGTKLAERGMRARSKGTPHVAFYVQHDGAVRQGAERERVLPGDAIEFAYWTPTDTYLAVLSVDGAGHASAYYERDSRAVPVAPGQGSTLDQSTILDATVGEETIYALFCDRAIELSPVVRALAEAQERAPSVPGCTVDRHVFLKVAP